MKNYILLLVLFATPLIWSQNYKFGKVSKEELEEAFYPLDSTADAAVLYSERKTHFDFIYDKGFYVVEKYFVRMKIYDPEAYEKATISISKYQASNSTKGERIDGIKAATYNLKNGKVVVSKLASSSVFDEKTSKNVERVKFTMPDLQPGCIVEWKYQLESPFLHMLDEVRLQEDIPIKKLNVKIITPEYFVYNTKIKGHLPVPIKKERNPRTINYTYTERVMTPSSGFQNVRGSSSLDFREDISNIELVNVPAIKDEPFSGNIDNYMSGIRYELSHTTNSSFTTEKYANNWESVVEKIFSYSSFGDQIIKTKYFKKEIDELISSTSNTTERVKLIFSYAKNKIKWNGEYRIYTDVGVKRAYELGVGNVAEVNLCLVAMLKYAGIDTSPVLVSTVNHGIPILPTMNGFNYVIARVNTPEGVILLDATEKNSVPNVLPNRVLNFRGRVVTDTGKSEWVELFPLEHSITKNLISAKFNEFGFKGTARKTITNHFLLNYRNEVREKNKEAIIEWIDEEMPNVEVINARVSNLDNLEKDAIETIQFESESFFEEITGKIYIDPLLYLQLEENPFKSEKREFPVFYNMPWAKITTINLAIPDTYTVESVPEGCEYILSDDLGFFQYNITQKGNVIVIKSSFVINQPVITPQDYKDLRELYANTITKQMEKIILSN